MQGLTLAVLRFYQRFISPCLPHACRFYPTCSQYMMEAVARHGAPHGIWLGLRRLARCHPWNPGGFDPVAGNVPSLERKSTPWPTN